LQRTLAFIAILAAGPTGALAQGRLSTTSLTCAQARAIVASHGAVVLGTGGITYQRFVAHGGFCERLEWARPTYAPTRDTPACPVGGVCVEMEPLEFD
jgi:hypothetical protein